MNIVITPVKIYIISNNANGNLTTTLNGHSTITISQPITNTTIKNWPFYRIIKCFVTLFINLYPHFFLVYK